MYACIVVYKHISVYVYMCVCMDVCIHVCILANCVLLQSWLRILSDRGMYKFLPGSAEGIYRAYSDKSSMLPGCGGEII